jgi:two-component system, response regulator PdtaR
MILPASDSEEERTSILVVEDEILVRYVICDYLRDCGFHVIEAGTADEALEYLRSHNDVGLVFSDVRMPGSLDGIGLSQQVRLLYPHIPVILTSGHLLPGEIDGTPLMTKPYVLGDVAQKIRAILDDAGGGFTSNSEAV